MSGGYPPGPQGNQYDPYGLTPQGPQQPSQPSFPGPPPPAPAGSTGSPYGQPTPYEPQPTFVGPPPQGYSGQPAGQPTYGQPEYGSGAYGAQGAPMPPAPPPKKKSSAGVIIAIVAGVVVLALIALVVVVVFVVNNKPDDMVKKYFAALADGNATEALSYAKTQPTDTTLLTDEVLRKSNELGTISDVKITSSSSSLVVVSMRIGSTTKSATYKVSKGSDGWQLDVAAWAVPIVTSSTVPLVVNGVKAPSIKNAYVFPGTYELTTGTKNLAWKESKQVFTGGTLQVPTSASVVVTDDGKKAAKAAISSLFSECTAVKSFNPKRSNGGNCPFYVKSPRSGSITSTIRWSIPTDPANSWVPSFSTDPTTVSGPVVYVIRLQYNYTANGQTYSADSTNTLTQTFVADMTADPVKITWR